MTYNNNGNNQSEIITILIDELNLTPYKIFAI